nr:hypothetical protein [Tanacetum cinerariifolium]
VELDESLVPSTQRLRIGRSNFRLPSDIQSKESTLQVVYDVLWNSPFFRAFQVTADVPEIYMQEFWAMAKLHHNSIRFKMDTKKSVLDLEAFREMLHISPRIPGQSFAELPSEEEILDFLRKPSISRRNRINWHYVRDDVLFSTIKVMFKEQKPNNSKLHSKAADKRRTSLNNVVLGFRMYHLMIQRKNFHRTLPMMKKLVSRLRK